MKKLILLFTLSIILTPQINGQDHIKEYGIKVYPFDKDSNDPASMSYLDDIVSDYNHFFMDEFHGKSIDENLKKKFISYLTAKKGLDKVVMEEPYAYGFWVNQYLQSGDTLLLRNFLTNYYLTDYGKSDASRVEEYYDFFKWVYQLNSEHNSNIRVEGIDVNFVNLKSDFWTLKQVFEKYKIAKDFPKDYERIIKLEKKKKVSRRQAKRWLKKFKKNRIAKEDVLNQKLKNDLIHFDNIVSNLSDALKMFTLKSYFSHPFGYRDSLMYLRYTQQVEPNEVAFSQFGGWHMLLSMGEKVQQLSGYRPEFKSYTSLLQKNPDYSGNCFSIYLAYGGKESSFGSGGYFFSAEEYNELKRKTNNQEVLLDFRDAEGSYEEIPEYYKIAIFLNGRAFY